MARTSFTWLRAAAVVAFATHASAQQCYYPNGNSAPSSEKPCSTAEGSACCPDTWVCLDNGLCHNPNGNLYGKYSCTDKTWKSSGCASNLCSYGGQLAGGEAITQCSNHDNDWCCNGDAVHVNCCQESPAPRPFFALQNGNAYATIGQNQASTNPNLATITGLASGTGSGSSGRSSAAQTSAAATSNRPSSAGSRASSVTAAGASPSATPTPSPITSVTFSLTSGSAGIQTIPITVTVTPSSNPTVDPAANNSSSSSSGKSSNIGLIVGCAVGIPLALALVGILIWMLRKRRQQKSNPYKETAEMDSHSPDFAGGAAAGLGKNKKFRQSRPDTAEIDGNPVGVGRPVSTVKGHAELESGTGFRPGHGTPYTPDTVGIGGGSGPDRTTWGSVPPQYSPGMNQTTFSHHPEASELDSTSVMPVINERSEATPQQYVAYRPPHPVAELPSVKTPPEDLEKQMHR